MSKLFVSYSFNHKGDSGLGNAVFDYEEEPCDYKTLTDLSKRLKNEQGFTECVIINWKVLK